MYVLLGVYSMWNVLNRLLRQAAFNKDYEKRVFNVHFKGVEKR